jgi:RNA polymerase sigma factor (sigma-70 family)
MRSVVRMEMRESTQNGVDRRDLYELYRAERAGLLWFLRAQGIPEHEADDAVQAAFLQLLRSSVPVREPRRWLRTVAFNHYRRSNPAVPGSRRRVVEVPFEPRALPDGATADAVEPTWAHDTIARLPEKQRWVMARHVEGRSHQEIADELGMTNASVRQNLRRARRTLGKRLQITDD